MHDALKCPLKDVVVVKGEFKPELIQTGSFW